MCNFVKEMARVIISEIHCSGINFSFLVSLFGRGLLYSNGVDEISGTS